MKVVVGKAFGHQTPVFSANMKQVIFRPYWNVPPASSGPNWCRRWTATPRTWRKTI